MTRYVALGCVILWLGSLVAIGAWQNDAGRQSERLVWQQRDNQELVAANAAIQKGNAEARATEHRHAAELADIAGKYEEIRQNAKAQKDQDLAAARAGALRLRYATSPAQTADLGAASSVASTPGGGNGAASGDLPPEITANLFALADDADEIVHQLSACQDVVRQDRSR